MSCQSYTGYDLPEVCSSGLTHVLTENTYNGIQVAMDGHTPLLSKETEIVMKHNYATFEIRRMPEGFIEVVSVVRTFENAEIFSKKFAIGRSIDDNKYHSLDYKESKRRYGTMCRQIHTNARITLWINRYMETFIIDKNYNFIF